MRPIAFAAGLALVLSVGFGAPASAWTTQVGAGTVIALQQQNGWTIQLRCDRASPGVLGVTLSGPRAGSLAGVTTLGIAAEMPGGERRATRIDVRSNGQVATGSWPVNPREMEIFAQGLRMGLRPGEDGRPIVTDMTGTAVARTAMRERCGF